MTGLTGRDFETVRNEIASLNQPAYIKDGDLRYVAVNDAYCALAQLGAERLVGYETRRAAAQLVGYDRDEKERRALVFGKQQTAVIQHRDEGRQFRARLHQICDRDGFRYIIGVLESKDTIRFEGWQDTPVVSAADAGRGERNETAGASVIPLRPAGDGARSGPATDMQTVLDALESAFVVWDRNNRLVACNRAFTDRFPLVKDWTQGRSIEDMVAEAADNGLIRNAAANREAWIDRALARLTTEMGKDVALRTATGKTVLWRGHTTAGGDRVLIATDVTSIIDTERQDAAGGAVNPAFFANVSHDIRTPMNGILGMAELLRTSGLDQKQQMFADVITKSAQALLDIFNDVVDYSRSEVGVLSIEEEPFNLDDVINDVASVYSARFAEKDLSLRIDMDAELPGPLVGDAFRIRQIVNNLLGNAIAHSDIGQITLSAHRIAGNRDEAVIRIAVRDCGPGMTAEQQRSMFDMFARAEHAASQGGDGVGLGLALCARLVRLMGGKIGIESGGDTGSEFWFELTLPVAQADVDDPKAIEAYSGSRILIVCADDMECEQPSDALSGLPLDCCVAESAGEGARVLQAARQLDLPIDLVVVCSAHDINGAMAVAAQMHGDCAGSAPPVILAGPGNLDRDAVQMTGLGIAAQIPSATDAAALRRAVLSALKYRDPAEGAPVGEADREHGPEDLAAAPQPERAPGATMVLVAEDNEVNQIVFAETLQQLGYAYQIVSDGAQAVAAWRKLRPDIVLMDVAMPVRNGLQATSDIRAAETVLGNRVPIIGVTAFAVASDQQRCLEAGMDDCLAKPISAEKLRDRLQTWLPGVADERTA
ncbi:response regulator [Nitratireductor sp. XY-223]|uniref:response regulator n=1 Tax=Nitratireductor sp. XY-223 TaxID=2561926 RepID=UPI0010AAF218|nr:response regulator [Nitratireductor sp. XY-223]